VVLVLAAPAAGNSSDAGDERGGGTCKSYMACV
jgi:hypothetical protein